MFSKVLAFYQVFTLDNAWTFKLANTNTNYYQLLQPKVFYSFDIYSKILVFVFAGLYGHTKNGIQLHLALDYYTEARQIVF